MFMRLYDMVDDSTTNDLVRWSANGSSFIVERHEEFAKMVLPRFYKHNTFASFVRQLNMYDFHKIPHIQQGVMIAESAYEIWEFSNPHFQRGRPDQLILVTRKKNKEKDTMNSDSPTIASLADDIATVKAYQKSIGGQLKNLHRDNEIIWHETLNSRDKYYRHQEAIHKILLFLSAAFPTDQITSDNSNIMPTNLIEEAATLADVTVSQDEVNKLKSSDAALDPSVLTNVLSSVLKLYSDDGYKEVKDESDVKHEYAALDIEDVNVPSLTEFSQTINTATLSANSITQDIDVLQKNIESLANDLGIDPTMCDDELNMDQFQNNYNTWHNQKMYTMNDYIFQTNALSSEKSQQRNVTATINPSQSSFSLQTPFSSYSEQPQPLFQRRQIKAKSQDKPALPIETNVMQPQPRINIKQNNIYQHFASSDSDSFGPNYPSGDLSEYEQATSTQECRSSSANAYQNGAAGIADMTKNNQNITNIQNNYVSCSVPKSPFYKKK
ncbi:unnamed protein product [Rhizopus stolonifer]